MKCTVSGFCGPGYNATIIGNIPRDSIIASDGAQIDHTVACCPPESTKRHAVRVTVANHSRAVVGHTQSMGKPAAKRVQADHAGFLCPSESLIIAAIENGRTHDNSAIIGHEIGKAFVDICMRVDVDHTGFQSPSKRMLLACSGVAGANNHRTIC